MQNILLILFGLLNTLNCRLTLNHFMNDQYSQINQTMYYFDEQIIDHFAPADLKNTTNHTFQQRYWIMDTYYNKSANGPILLYICGESTCQGVYDGFPVTLAQKFNMLVVAIEHRYYGASQPFQNQSTENLRYLTPEQALADLAYFITLSKQNYFSQISPQSPWITMGGSYPGALSAWFRSKYPQLTVGALASSAVITAILDFYQFDEQVFNSSAKSGVQCTQQLQTLTNYIESQLNTTGEAFKKRFSDDAVQLTDPEFLFFTTDAIAQQVQYGQRKDLCAMLNDTTEQALLNLIDYIKAKKFSAQDYGAQFVRNITYDINKNARQWNFQTCSQLAYLQTPSPNPLLRARSQQLSLDFYKQWCKDSFGTDLWPDVSHANMIFGSEDLEISNVVFTNGGEDPWQWASMVKDRADVIKFLIDCEDCGHCVEFRAPSPSDSLILKYTRTRIQQEISVWLDQYYYQNQKIVETFIKEEI